MARRTTRNPRAPKRRNRRNPEGYEQIPTPGTPVGKAKGVGSVLMEMAEHGLRQGVGDLGKGLANYARQEMKRVGGQAMRGLLSTGSGMGVDNEIDPATGSPKWLSKLLAENWNIFVIIGQMGSGKTVLAWALAESRGRPIYMLDCPSALAGHATPVRSIEEAGEIVPPGATLIIDDAQQYIASRSSMSKSNIDFQSLIFTIRHKQITLIITAQDSSSIDKTGLVATAYLLKEPTMAYAETERGPMKKIFDQAVSSFRTYPQDRWKEFVFVYRDPDHNGLLQYAPPDWYTASISRYRGGHQGSGGGNQPGVADTPQSTSNGVEHGHGGSGGGPQEYPVELREPSTPEPGKAGVSWPTL